MMSEAHTPGPWFLDGHNLSSVIHCTVPKGHPDARHVCGDYEQIASAHGDNWQANARLIAAGPDMLAELRKQVDWLRHIRPQLTGKVSGSVITGLDQSIKYMTAAIAKAEGRE